MSIIKSSVFKFILYTACLAAISSCTDEIGQQPVPDRDDYLHFSAGIEKTRAETGQDGTTRITTEGTSRMSFRMASGCERMSAGSGKITSTRR